MNIDCPHCSKSVEVGASDTDDMHCPSCGTIIKPQGGHTRSFSDIKQAEADEQQTDRTRSFFEETRILGRFELLERVGSGGMGEVWRARDPELDRFVAVKIPHAGRMGTEQDRERFMREGRSTAQLRHPGIVSVHQVGHDEKLGVPYLVTDFIEGVTLADLLTTRQLDVREAVELVAQIADSLAYAHSMGVVHRDIKPSNIMLDSEEAGLRRSRSRLKVIPPNEPASGPPFANTASPALRPLITDFGLARRDDIDITMTADGQVLGTPAFMSPEQAAGMSHEVDARSDIYSLGVVLYKLLTGALPFQGNSRMLLQQVLREEPKPLRRMNPKIPRDLETATLKCMAKEPVKRYPSAAEFAADLRRWLAGEPIRARRVGPAERLWRWSRRNPTLAVMSAVVLGLLAVTAVVSTVSMFRIEAAYKVAKLNAERETIARGEAEEAQKTADQNAEESRLRLIRQYVDNGVRLMDRGDFLASLPWLTEALLRDPEREAMHRMRIAAVLRHCPKLTQVWFHSEPARSAEFSRDGKRVVSASDDGTARVWDVQGGGPVAVFWHQAPVNHAAFSPDGTRVLTRSEDWTARIWDVATSELVATLVHEGAVSDAVFSPDGRQVVTSSLDRTARVWDANTGEPVTPPLRHSVEVWHASFSPDGRRLLTAAGSFEFFGTRLGIGVCSVWDAATGDKVFDPIKQEALFYEAAFSPDGKRIVTACDDSSARVWNADTGVPLTEPMKHLHPVKHVSFSADGRLIITVGNEEAARVWDSATGRLLTQPLTEQSGAIQDAAFGSDGHCVVSVCFDQTVRIWDVNTGQLLTPPLKHTGHVVRAAFSPSGQQVVTADSDGIVRVWDIAAPGIGLPPLRHSWSVNDVQFSSDGALVLTASGDRTVRVWRALSEEATVEFMHSNWVNRASFSGDSRRIVSGCRDGKAYVWDVARAATSIPAIEVQHDDRVQDISFNHDGTRFVTASLDGFARIWESTAGQPIGKPLKHDGPVNSAAFNPDGRFVVTASKDGKARVWETETGKLLAELPHDGEVDHASFSPDGSLLVTASKDRTARVWQTASGSPVGSPMCHKDGVHFAAFDPTGHSIVTASLDHTARIWDAATGEPRTPLLPHSDNVSHAAFSRDGKLVLTGCGGPLRGEIGEARVWDTSTGEAITPVLLHRDDVQRVAFSPTGRQIATASYDTTARVWLLLSDDRPPSDLVRIAQLMSNSRIDATGALVPLDQSTLAKSWDTLRTQYADDFARAPDEALAWHRREAEQCEKERLWLSTILHLDPVIYAGSNRSWLLASRGSAHAELGHLTEASTDLAQAVELGAHDGPAEFELAVLLLNRGDAEGYRTLCQRMLDRWTPLMSNSYSSWTARTCTLARAAVSDPKRVVPLAEKTIKAMNPNSNNQSREITLAAAHLRSGKTDEALTQLTHVTEAYENGGTVDCWLLLAIAHGERGNAAEAARWLTKSQQWLDRRPPEFSNLPWHERLLIGLWRREAESRLGSSSQPMGNSR